ncbi:hypothetical protein EV641_1097 [Rhodococcus sp. SMB37]|uniref:hypothetical protein n=1 Tax=Rhodococcus sp. SMB37 TaxID=2512213 RepID=UPI0006D1EBD0|nr:hypothetical protein [Rhodococcus sp. SMB37]TCN51620.1 hypothetical protein EV641_1097 [Rhodococcus sp. SMB37]
MPPTDADPPADQEIPVYMLPDGTILASTDAHGKPMTTFNGMPVGTGPHGEIVLMPTGWTGDLTGTQWTRFPGTILDAAGPAPRSLFGGF